MHRPSEQVLVVEDSQSVRAAVQSLLEEAGYQVQTAEDGVEGLEVASAGNFDLVLTDVQMPRMDGLDLIASLRKNPAYATTPILVLTTMSQVNMVRRARELGAAGWMGKPFDPEHLLRSVKAALRMHPSHRSDAPMSDSADMQVGEEGEPRRILVVEDSPTTQQTICDTLHSAGYQTARASDGLEGLEMVKKNDYMLVVSDVQMPRMNGVQMLRQIRELDVGKALPVIILTTEAQPSLVKEGRAAGAAAWLLKPVDPVSLARSVSSTLQKLGGVTPPHQNSPGPSHDLLPSAVQVPSAQTSTYSASPSDDTRLVLVVDDSSTIRDSVRETLEEAGYRVNEAVDGLEALDLARRQQFDLVVSDMQMPNMDGLGLINALRAEPSYRETPILILSTMTQTDLVRRSREAGADAWLFKPCEPNVLLRGIDSILKSRA